MSAVAVGLVALTGLPFANSVAPASAAAPAAPWNCGLKTRAFTGFGPVPRTWHYQIGNCHRFTVKRRVIVNRGWDGRCHTIRPGSIVKGAVTLVGANASAARRMKPC